MKVIELLNKIANGEIEEDTMFEYSYGNRYTARQFFDSYIMDRENLNCEVEVIEEDKKMPTLKNLNLTKIDINKEGQVYNATKKEMIADIQTLQKWINKIIDKMNTEDMVNKEIALKTREIIDKMNKEK